MSVSVVSEEVIEPRAPLRLVPTAPEPPAKIREPISEEVFQVMGKLAQVLAIRVMLALAIIGAFVLALIAMSSPTLLALVVFGMWGAGVIGPLTYLAQRKT